MHPNIHQPLIADFTEAVLVQREPAVGGAIGREGARLEELIYHIQPGSPRLNV